MFRISAGAVKGLCRAVLPSYEARVRFAGRADRTTGRVGAMNEARRRGKVPMTPGWRFVAISLLGLALLTTPVSYRAGTDVSHAHSFVHFLSDAASGAMDHHRHRRARHMPAHVRSRAEPPTHFSAAALGTPQIEPYRGAFERSTAIGLVLLTAFFFLGAGAPLARAHARKLFGIDARPPVPPPRPASSAVF